MANVLQWFVPCQYCSHTAHTLSSFWQSERYDGARCLTTAGAFFCMKRLDVLLIHRWRVSTSQDSFQAQWHPYCLAELKHIKGAASWNSHLKKRKKLAKFVEFVEIRLKRTRSWQFATSVITEAVKLWQSAFACTPNVSRLHRDHQDEDIHGLNNKRTNWNWFNQAIFQETTTKCETPSQTFSTWHHNRPL